MKFCLIISEIWKYFLLNTAARERSDLWCHQFIYYLHVHVYIMHSLYILSWYLMDLSTVLKGLVTQWCDGQNMLYEIDPQQGLSIVLWTLYESTKQSLFSTAKQKITINTNWIGNAILHLDFNSISMNWWNGWVIFQNCTPARCKLNSNIIEWKWNMIIWLSESFALDFFWLSFSHFLST